MSPTQTTYNDFLRTVYDAVLQRPCLSVLDWSNHQSLRQQTSPLLSATAKDDKTNSSYLQKPQRAAQDGI